MGKQKSAGSDKKKLRKEVAVKLTVLFSDIKESVGDKQFARNVKKASKILATGKVTKESKKNPKKTKTSDEIVVAAAAMS